MTEKMTKRIKIHANDKIGSSSYFMPVNDLLSGHDSKHGVVWCTFYFSKNLFFSLPQPTRECLAKFSKLVWSRTLNTVNSAISDNEI